MRKDTLHPGIGTGGLNRLKTHCWKGHPLYGKNLWVCVRHDGRKDRRCRICYRQKVLDYRDGLKQRVFQALGGKCVWPGCAITDIDMLTVDHVQNDGSKMRVRHITNTESIYRRILREGVPRNKYQALCANHNLKKEIERRHAARIK